MPYRKYDHDEFPNAIDEFSPKEDLQNSDKEYVKQYHELWEKENKTAEDEAKLEQLAKHLDKYLYTAEHINKFQNSVVKIQRFYKEGTQGHVKALQVETEAYMDDRKLDMLEYSDNTKLETKNYVDLNKADMTKHTNNAKTEFRTEIDKFTYKGVYAANKQYLERNIVDYNDGASNQSYMALQNVKGVSPTDASKWLKLTIQGTQGERGEDGLGLKFRGAYDNTVVYARDDGIRYGGLLFGSLVGNNVGELPNVMKDTDHWARIMESGVIVQKMIGVRNVVTSTNTVNFMTGDIEAYNPTIDSLEVYLNSNRLTKDIDYKLSRDERSINKVNGSWQGSSSEPNLFEFVVTKNVATNLVYNDGSAIQKNTIREDALEPQLKDKINRNYVAVSKVKPSKKYDVWFEIMN